MKLSSYCVCSNSECPLRNTGFRPYRFNRNKKRNRFNFLLGKVLVVEGNIGSGKSSSAKEMTRFLSDECELPAVYMPEYINLELLKIFIEDMKTHAYTFQLFMLEQRAECYRKAIELANSGHIVIMDRMMYGDLAFAYRHYTHGNITHEQFDCYRNIMNGFGFNDPALTIYLFTTAEKALQRAKKRDRKNESYTLEYFKEIEQAYSTVMEEYKGDILEIDFEEDLLIEEFPAKIEEILNKCIDFLLS